MITTVTLEPTGKPDPIPRGRVVPSRESSARTAERRIHAVGAVLFLGSLGYA